MIKKSTQNYPSFKLIITAALIKEIPKDWFLSQHIAVYTLESLKSGVHVKNSDSNRSIMVLITGPGLDASKEAAAWILKNMNPLYVLNIGTCGVLNKRYPLGGWIRPLYVLNEHGKCIRLDTRLPIPHFEGIIDVETLLSTKEERINKMPDSWKRYDAVDMECYEQARVFSSTRINLHCLKFTSDYSDSDTYTTFNRNLKLFNQKVKKIFSFVEERDSEPEVSVIIPVYNRQQTIRLAIDSVLNQSYKADEIIVVDDGSTDRTNSVIKEYRNKIKIITLPKNSGVSRSRNEGIKHAGNELIAFLDSDDEWQRDKLKNQIDYLRVHPFYEILQSEEIWIRNGRRVNPCKHHKKHEGWIWEKSLQRCIISPSSVLVRKALLQRYNLFNEDMPVCEDYDLWLKISRYHPVGLEPVFSIIKYGGHEDQLSRRYPAMDRYRVMTLMHLLKNESDEKFGQSIISILTKKLQILIKGHEKRKRFKEAEGYKEIMHTFVSTI